MVYAGFRAMDTTLKVRVNHYSRVVVSVNPSINLVANLPNSISVIAVVRLWLHACRTRSGVCCIGVSPACGRRLRMWYTTFAEIFQHGELMVSVYFDG